MIKQTYRDVVTPELLEGAVENNEFTGFLEDYHVLHCLLRIYKPKRFLEIGTNMGFGTKIIKNALGDDSEVYTLDLPTENAHKSLQHPISEGKGDRVGSRCDLPFTQLRGDSTKYDYKKLYPINGWYIDGEHTTINVYIESCAAFKSGAQLIVWHDSDLKEVEEGINKAANSCDESINYYICRVIDTRIAYARRKLETDSGLSGL